MTSLAAHESGTLRLRETGLEQQPNTIAPAGSPSPRSSPNRSQTSASRHELRRRPPYSPGPLPLSGLLGLPPIFSWAEDPVALFGDTIISQLRAIGAAPWGDFFGHVLTSRELAKLLTLYGVRSRDVWIAGTTRKARLGTGKGCPGDHERCGPDGRPCWVAGVPL
jgi:Protein of unknown function (DUF3631)